MRTLTKDVIKYYSDIGRAWYENTLIHHGVPGMHWGVQNGPPYPISRRVRYKVPEMSEEEYKLACFLWDKYDEIYVRNKNQVYEHFDNNLTVEEKQCAVVSSSMDKYTYTAVNKGHNQYKIFHMKRTDQEDTIHVDDLDYYDQIMDVVFEGPEWRRYVDGGDY